MKLSGSTTVWLPSRTSDEADELPIDVLWEATHTPGVTSGPPENCYPDDTELEVTSIKLHGDDFEPTDDEWEIIEEQCLDLMWVEY